MQLAASITNEQEKAVNLSISSDVRQDQIKPETATLTLQKAASQLDDLVNLSAASLAEASASSGKKTSIAVSNEEKTALLASKSSIKNFSIYG